MGKNSPSKRKYWDRIRLQWAPVLRAVREFAIVARKAPRENELISLARSTSPLTIYWPLTAANCRGRADGNVPALEIVCRQQGLAAAKCTHLVWDSISGIYVVVLDYIHQKYDSSRLES